MTVAEAIEQLKTFPQDATLMQGEAYYDWDEEWHEDFYVVKSYKWFDDDNTVYAQIA